MSSPYATMIQKLNRVYGLPDGRFVAEMVTVGGQLHLVEDYSALVLYDRICRELRHLPTGSMQVNIKFLALLVDRAAALKAFEQNLYPNAA